MDKKIVKTLRNINRFLDDDYKKLCDKYDELELSHNRKKKALEELSRIFTEFTSHCSAVTFETNGVAWREIRKIVSDALFCDGRERSKR